MSDVCLIPDVCLISDVCLMSDVSKASTWDNRDPGQWGSRTILIWDDRDPQPASQPASQDFESLGN